jgi:hypothetical protein
LIYQAEGEIDKALAIFSTLKPLQFGRPFKVSLPLQPGELE